MPRAGWLAVGGICAALVAQELSGTIGAAVALPLVLMVGALAAARTGHVPAAAVMFGAAFIAARLVVPVILGGTTPQLPVPTEQREWTAQVATVGSTAGGMQRAVIVAADGSGGEWRAYGWLPRYPTVAPSDRIRFDAALDPLEPDGLDQGFLGYLVRNDVVATTRLREFELLPPTGPHAVLEGLRRSGGVLLAQVLPAPGSGLAAGILIGLRDQVDRDVAADFTDAGLSHVVAISGWNIALVGGVVASALRRRSRRQRATAVLAAIVVYTFLAGASPSVVRAAVMASVCLMARESGRRGGAATALGLAAWSMLLIDPGIVSDAGFQLSVAATAGLLTWSRPWSQWLRARTPRWIPDWLVESLAVSLSAQAATLPLILLAFGRFSVVAPVANLVIAPILAPVMVAALVALLAGLLVAIGLPAMLIAPIALGGSLLLGSMIAIAHAAASIPFASIELAPPAGALAALATTCLIAIIGTAAGRSAVGRFVRVFRGTTLPAATARRESAITRTGCAERARARSPRGASRGGRHLWRRDRAHRGRHLAGDRSCRRTVAHDRARRGPGRRGAHRGRSRLADAGRRRPRSRPSGGTSG